MEVNNGNKDENESSVGNYEPANDGTSPPPLTNDDTSPSPAANDATTTRHEWTSVEIRKLLGLIKDNMHLLKAARTKAPIWRDISQQMGIPADKCMDKFKYLKKAYRNYIQLKNKSGAAPASFEFADEIEALMGDDPSVVPTYTTSSDAPTQDDSVNSENSDGTETSGKATRKTKCRNSAADQMINYLKERDESLKTMMQEMHKESMEAMNRLIDKF